MDLLDLLKLMGRRWYVTVPIVIVTLGASLLVGSSIEPDYKTSAAVVLVPPTTQPAPPASNQTPQPGNPWLRVGETAMAQAIQISVSTHEAREQVSRAGGDPEYEIGLVNRSSILTVEITTTSSQRAVATVRAVIELIRNEVAARQAEYKPKAGEDITAEVLDPGTNVTPSRSDVLRAQIVLAAIGLLLAATGAVIYDAIERRRETARQDRRRAAGGRVPGAMQVGRSHAPATDSRASDRTGTANGGNPGTQPTPPSYGRPAQTDDTVMLTAFRQPRQDTK